MDTDLKQIIQPFADNPILFGAIKNIIESKFSEEKASPELPNELLGQITRARLEGLNKVEAAFKEIALYKSIPDTPEKTNQAR